MRRSSTTSSRTLLQFVDQNRDPDGRPRQQRAFKLPASCRSSRTATTWSFSRPASGDAVSPHAGQLLSLERRHRRDDRSDEGKRVGSWAAAAVLSPGERGAGRSEGPRPESPPTGPSGTAKWPPEPRLGSATPRPAGPFRGRAAESQRAFAARECAVRVGLQDSRAIPGVEGDGRTLVTALEGYSRRPREAIVEAAFREQVPLWD